MQLKLQCCSDGRRARYCRVPGGERKHRDSVRTCHAQGAGQRDPGRSFIKTRPTYGAHSLEHGLRFLSRLFTTPHPSSQKHSLSRASPIWRALTWHLEVDTYNPALERSLHSSRIIMSNLTMPVARLGGTRGKLRTCFAYSAQTRATHSAPSTQTPALCIDGTVNDHVGYRIGVCAASCHCYVCLSRTPN
jgi:hypothetical protein